MAEQTATAPLWLTEADVRESLDLNGAIAALEQGIRAEAAGAATNLEKMLGVWPPASSLHCLGSMMPARGYVGFKTWANTPAGASALFSLFDAQAGQLKAVLAAGLLGSLRTSGISGIATRVLAPAGADEMALVGSGRQALLPIAAIAAVVPLRRLRVFSPTAENRTRFVAQVRTLFGFAVEAADTLDAACADMPIVTLITRAATPFLPASVLARGAHLNAAGAILPANAEFHDDVFDRADLVVVDSLANARKASKELRDRYGPDDAAWAGVRTLGGMLEAGEGRPADADLTVFKPMGMGISDLSVAVAVYESAVAAGRGLALPVAAAGGPPRWTAAGPAG